MRAWLLSGAGDAVGAARTYERAVALRPRDHVLWVELGKVREQAGDAEGALRALARAAELAPHYSQPRWQLGNALLRAGRGEEAQVELRLAAESDASLYPNFLQIVWHTAGKDAKAFARAAQPRTPEQTLAVARFLISSGAAGEGMRMLRESGAGIPEEARRALLANLLAADDFKDAYEFWSAGRGAGGGRGILTDGGFEESARTDDEGFGWRFAREQAALKFSLDADAPREGARSLRVEFAGSSDPATAAVSQLVLVEPGARYRLKFSARARDLVTGGLPFVEVTSAAKGAGGLASSPPFTPKGGDWQDYAVEFAAPAGSEAVRLSLKRQPCPGSPCPAFGSVWLDSFELKKL